MQEASGADFTDLNWSAQPSSVHLATNHGLQFFPCNSFSPLLQANARGAGAPAGMSHGAGLRTARSRGNPCRIANMHDLDIGIDPGLDDEDAGFSWHSALTGQVRQINNFEVRAVECQTGNAPDCGC